MITPPQLHHVGGHDSRSRQMNSSWANSGQMGRGMKRSSEGAYDPATLTLLRSVLDDAWDELPPARRASTPKSEVAVRILRLARRGERDPSKLRAAALTGVVTKDDGHGQLGRAAEA